MNNIVDFPPPAGPDGPRSIIGPPASGNHVIVDARVIPRMTATETADGIEIVLDRRFAIVVSRDDAYPVAWMIAQALAIGQGYSSVRAESRDQPFAPQYRVMDAGPEQR